MSACMPFLTHMHAVADGRGMRSACGSPVSLLGCLHAMAVSSVSTIVLTNKLACRQYCLDSIRPDQERMFRSVYL